MATTSFERAMQSSFAPISGPVTPFALTSVGTAPTALFPQLGGIGAVRRVSLVNTHASQVLGVLLLPAGQNPVGSETPATAGVRPIPAGASWDFPITSAMQAWVVGSGAATTLGGFAHDI